MTIGGTIYINEYNYFEWKAVNVGRAGTELEVSVCVYEVTLDMRNDRGYPHHIEYNVVHDRRDGMLVLTSIILNEANRRINT